MEVMKIGHDLNALNHVIIILKFRKKEGKMSISNKLIILVLAKSVVGNEFMQLGYAWNYKQLMHLN